MNDDELSTLVREQRAKISMSTPVDEIISRGRSVRARRRISGLAVTLATAGGAAVAAAALVPAGHPVPSQPAAQLAAWTVTRQADGDIDVSIRELRDPAGLQATLRADGLPAHVSFSGPTLAPSCQAYPASAALLPEIYQFHPGDKNALLVIDPSALPSGVGAYIHDVVPRVRVVPAGKKQPAGVRTGLAVGVRLVYTSQPCTG